MVPEVPMDTPAFAISGDIKDVLTPGVAVEVDVELARALGAFEETALSDEAATFGNLDLADQRG